jgi:hypothetical protein
MKGIEYTFEEGSEPIPCEMYVDLAIFSKENDFNLSELTQILHIEPTATWHKGDMIRKDLYRKETCWCLKTSCIKTSDFEEVFLILVNILNDKIPILGKYAKENKLHIKIDPVIVVSNNMPSIIITKEIAEILLMLDATLEFDMYFA